jgi:hypothetical protein
MHMVQCTADFECMAFNRCANSRDITVKVGTKFGKNELRTIFSAKNDVQYDFG